jgi:predicted ribosome quality control (RQC) complex YloA/Tae2 family protein
MTDIELLSRWASEVRAWLKNSALAHQERADDPLKEKLSLQKELGKYLKRATSKLQMLQGKLIECQSWQQIHHEGLLLQSHLYRWKHGLHTLEVEDWEQENHTRKIQLTPPLSGQDEVALRFRKSKKLRLGISHTEREMQKVEAFRGCLVSLLEKIESMTELKELHHVRQLLFIPVLKQTLELKKQARALPYREYWSASGHPIWVGKKAIDNEVLSFSLAHGSDWWLHVQGFPGSHVIIKGFKQNEPDQESLQDALQLALFHSQAKKAGSADVIITQQKYLTRFGKGKNNIGKVQVSKYKTQHVHLDLSRIEKIKKQKPDRPSGI